jgi:hypothetical protein
MPDSQPLLTPPNPKVMYTGTFFFTQKHKNIPFPPEKRYLRRSGWHSTVQGLRHTWAFQDKHSFEHSFFPATQLFPLRVGCLVGCCVGCCVVFMLLMLSLFTLLPHCQHCCRRYHWHTAATATAIGWQGG